MVRRTYRVRPPVVDDLAGWCDAHGVDSFLLSPAEHVRRHAPTVLGATPHPSFEKRLSREIDQRFLAPLPHARVRGRNGLVILHDGSFAVEAIYWRDLLEHDQGYFRPMPTRVVSMDGDYFSLLGKFSNGGNYYHWIHDALLRLHGVQTHLPSGVKYFVPPILRKFQRETLAMLGLREDQLVPFSGEEVWECERLWFASLPPSGAEVKPAVAWLRERLTMASEPKRRFYISRARATHARVVNEDALIPVLASHGVEVIDTEGMSAAEQVRLFAQAEAIIAPHGAGLTNMVFASATCRILELVEPQWASDGYAHLFWSLAETLGQPYAYMVGKSVANPEHPNRPDLYVPPEVLEGALRVFLVQNQETQP